MLSEQKEPIAQEETAPPKETARRYKSRAEAENARPRLDPSKPIPRDQFEDLVGYYTLQKEDRARCQLVTKDGRCNESHGIGYLAKLKNGVEGYIGHECAEREFGADPRFAVLFAAARARVDREVATQEIMDQLTAALESPDIAQGFKNGLALYRELEHRTIELLGALNLTLRKKLEDRQKRTGPDVMVNILKPELEEDSKSKETYWTTRRLPTRVGTLAGLAALDLESLQKIGARIRNAETALLHAEASRERSDKQMKGWLGHIQYGSRVMQDLREREALLNDFCELPNLKLLWLLRRQRLDQEAIVRVVLEITSRTRVTDNEAAKTRARWAQEIRDRNDGRDFEVMD